MDYPLVPYQNISLEVLDSLPQDQLEAISLDLLRYCNHTVRATSESIRASLARMDAMDKVGRLITPSRNALDDKVSS